MEEMAAQGLCFRCYRAQTRSAERDELWAASRTGKRLAQAQRASRRALLSIMDAADNIEKAGIIDSEFISQLRALLAPEVKRIHLSLQPSAPVLPQLDSIVNSEHLSTCSLFTDAPPESEAGDAEPAQARASDTLTSPLPPSIPQRITPLKREEEKNAS